ncbi:YggS family pyridoxal phosphate-dependent enzyme [Cellulomonas sp. JH27-2]|uniref:YggS family pyridoxal phosphate-dependent enzyme n=1 Tax=Cellulomonas sp. JH27-2 TaxID=2774139 RepID=UPI00177BA418|nr:YggS family pyridoxal phosphate-dependent enzyme [Cellulomonas sp. JH27-2]MBD8059912.1 YggS family pyridoxal phosphate-dependent enzyme [Cellulomonas sp. JH27-2]
MDEDLRRAVAARLTAVRRRIAAAADAAGRDPHDVRLLLASKTMPADVVAAALAADEDRGADALPVLLGENRVQELVAKAPVLADLHPTWHVIGPLQSNKVNPALRWASCVESVASIELAQRLADRAPGGLDVMVQVNVSGEPTKHGVRPEQAAAMAADVAGLGGLRLTGFMTVGANSADDALVRAGYRALRELRDEVVERVPTAVGLSMGMSRDLEAAVAEGATLVRVGSAVFGPR